MVKMRAGEKKKALILNTCKKLFYEKGYIATTYEDICKAADVPPGSITYHFTSKRNIAAEILSEYELKVRTMMSILTDGKYDSLTLAALEIISWWDRFFHNPNLKRFATEMASEGIARQATFSDIKYFFSFLIKENKIDIDEKRLNVITAAHIGLVTEMIFIIEENKLAFSMSEIAAYVIENDLKALNIDYKTISETIKKAHQIYDELRISINNSYFEYFSYDENLLNISK